MKYAHMADCHIGGWKDPRMRDVSVKAFLKAVDKCIEENVDFILISGDLFNTAMPPVDILSTVVKKLKLLKDKGIPVYMIAGSHDFSPSQKTILNVLFNAGLAVNTAKGKIEDDKLYLNFSVDEKTGAKITGMIGKKGGLEKSYYESLVQSPLEKEEGYKIFMFHTALTELKPKGLEKMDSAPVSFLPKGFDYYAGGHVHVVDKADLDGRTVVYPGPLFPNNFAELEKLQNGGFYIVEGDNIRYEPIIVNPSFSMDIDCNEKTPKECEQMIESEIKNKEFINTIVTIRLRGELRTGKPSDINFRDIFKQIYDKSAYFVMKSSSMLGSKEFKEVKVDTSSVENVEQKLIDENCGQIKAFDLETEKKITKKLMDILSLEKNEGEKKADFEKRVVSEAKTVLEKG